MKNCQRDAFVGQRFCCTIFSWRLSAARFFLYPFFFEILRRTWGVGRDINKRNMCLVGGKTKDVGLLRNENELTVSSVLFFAVELHVTNGTYHRDLEIPS